MTSLTSSKAQETLAHGIQFIQAQNYKDVCLSICDAQGFLIAFVRMERAPLRSIEIAQNKAYTSVRLGSTTEVFHQKLQQAGFEISYYGDARLTGMAGGACITGPQGETLGGVGVSGLLPQEDQVVANELARFAAGA